MRFFSFSFFPFSTPFVLFLLLYPSHQQFEALVWEKKKMGLVSFSLPSQGRISFTYDQEGRLTDQKFFFEIEAKGSAQWSSKSSPERALQQYARERYSGFFEAYDAEDQSVETSKTKPLQEGLQAHYIQEGPELDSFRCSYADFSIARGRERICRQLVGAECLRLKESRPETGHLHERVVTKETKRELKDLKKSARNNKREVLFRETEFYDQKLIVEKIRSGPGGQKLSRISIFRDIKGNLERIEVEKEGSYDPVTTIVPHKDEEAREFNLRGMDAKGATRWVLTEPFTQSKLKRYSFTCDGDIAWEATRTQLEAQLDHEREEIQVNGVNELLATIILERDPEGRLLQIDYRIKEERFLDLSSLVWEQFHLMGKDFCFEQDLFAQPPTPLLMDEFSKLDPTPGEQNP